jgi:hypothetical protein
MGACGTPHPYASKPASGVGLLSAGADSVRRNERERADDGADVDEVGDGLASDGIASTGIPAWQSSWGMDLAAQRPGHAVLANIQAKLAMASLETQQGLLGVVPEDLRNWAVGYVGEEHVGLELARLPEGWHVLHAVPIGGDGSDIDHVVIGPPGVFTINTKHHRGQTVDVKGDATFIAGTYQRYVAKSRSEAQRTQTALGAALQGAVPVHPAVCVVGGAVRVREPAVGVAVVTSPNLVRTLTAQQAQLSPEQVAAVYAVARRSRTWTEALPPAAAADWVADYARRLATPPTAAFASNLAAGGRRTRSRSQTMSRPVSRRGRSRSRRKSGSPAQLFVALALLAFLALGGTKVVTSVLQGVSGRLVPAPTPTPASTAYLAPASVPVATPGAACPSTKARGRYPLNDQLLLCQPDAIRKLVWVFADPWLRLPASLTGVACSPAGIHGRSVTLNGALLCRKNATGALTWEPDPNWTP